MEVRRKFVSRAFVRIYAQGSRSCQTQIILTRRKLSNIRTKAVRQGIWFRVLSRAERVYMELAMKVVERVRSRLVAKLLTSIIEKLLDATRTKVSCMMKEIGQAWAQKLSRIAQNWGNVSASRWVKNRGFIQYLAVTYMNTPTMFKLHYRI